MKYSSGERSINQWVDQAKMGNQQSARKIYDQYARAMYNILYRMTRNEMEAQDLLQEAFIRAFRYLESFKGESTFGAWLKRIVINTGLENQRKRKPEWIELDQHHDSLESKEEEINWTEILRDVSLVRKAILQLPEGTRNVLTLYLLEGYTHEEIGDLLGISPSTSKTQYMRGKALVKDMIIKNHGKRFI